MIPYSTYFCFPPKILYNSAIACEDESSARRENEKETSEPILK